MEAKLPPFTHSFHRQVLSTYSMPSTVLGAGRTKVQSLVSVACYLAEKTDTETYYYNVVNMITEVLSTYLGSPEGEPETIWGAGKGLMRW